jgi:hypothetical protein
MSHEIQTPINAMLGFTEASRRGMYDAPAQQTEYLDQPSTLESTITNTVHSSACRTPVEQDAPPIAMLVELPPTDPMEASNVARSLDSEFSRVEVSQGGDPNDTCKIYPPELTVNLESSAGLRKPITFELPFDDPEFREIIPGFVDKLKSDVEELQIAWQNGDLETVGYIAHWLKGTAGTMGFRDWTKSDHYDSLLANGSIQQSANWLRRPKPLVRCRTRLRVRLQSIDDSV